MGMRHVFALTLALLASSTAQAQQAAVDPRWEPWLGCWVPEVRHVLQVESPVCIVPSADGRGVTLRAFEGTRELPAETFTADGAPQAVTASDCSGERVTQWATRGVRFFSTARMACSGQPSSTTSSVSTLLRSDLWLDVHVSGVNDGEQVRARRMRRSLAAPPAAVADLVRSRRPVPVTPAVVLVDDVLEANRLVPATAVEAWLAESGARAALDRKGLGRLADAQVEERVIDLLVAMAYPQKFQVRRAADAGGVGGFGGFGGFGSGGFFGGGVDDGFYPGNWGYLADVYGYGFGSFGLPYFLGTGAFYRPDALYTVPAVGGGASTQEEHGRVINGQGYTRVQPREPYQGTASSGGSRGRTSSSGGVDASGGYSGSSASGDSSGSSGASPSGYSGGGSSTGQTAVPR